MVYAQPRIHLRKWGTKNSLGLRDENGSSNLGQTTSSCDSKKKKKKKKKGREPTESRNEKPSANAVKSSQKSKKNIYTACLYQQIVDLNKCS